MQIDLTGYRAFITAGADGMGLATAKAMHWLGADVAVCDIDRSALADLPDGITGHYCNVSDPEQITALMNALCADGLDILVNNAGIGGPTQPVEDVSIEDWRHCMAVCIDAQFYCARIAVPIFKAQQSGVIINMISAAGLMGFPNRSPYVAAKWAASGFTKTLAMELGPDNIRVNGIVPGNVNGARMQRIIKAHAEAENISQDAVRNLYAIGTSMQCYVEPQEIADMICYLCSDYGRHISGQIIGIDGHTESLYPRQMGMNS